MRNFLLSNALFWLDKYHIDGLRVDAVASMLYLDFSRKQGAWVPNKYGGTREPGRDRLPQALQRADAPRTPRRADDGRGLDRLARGHAPTYLGGLGFDLKWNMGWMNDMLNYMDYDPIYRRYHHNLITFSLMYAFTENFLLPLSHDEVVHLKKIAAGQDARRRLAAVRHPARALSATVHPPRQEAALHGRGVRPAAEWNEITSIDWQRAGSRVASRSATTSCATLLHLYKSEPALCAGRE